MSQRRRALKPLQQTLFRRADRGPQWNALPIDVRRETIRLVAALLRVRREANPPGPSESVGRREESDE